MRRSTIVLYVLIAAIAIGLYMRFSGCSKEGFFQKEVGAPRYGTHMGPYDSMQQDGAQGWLANEHASVTLSDSPRGMLLADASSSPECCPSPFTTDQGCVCLSDRDKETLASRAGNR